MQPIVGAGLVTFLGAAQIALASAVSATIAKHLAGIFHIDDAHMSTCALSMKGNSVCTAGYVSTAVSILLSLGLIAMQCATAEGRSGLGFCGPLISALGFFWWGSYAAAATVAARGAQEWETSLTSYRTATFALSWSVMVLFLLTFFISAAAASATACARSTSQEERCSRRGRSEARSLSKRFNQPSASPPVSPSKSNRSCGGAYEPFEGESPKKWTQPHNTRSSKTVTSDGLHTLLVVAGAPVPLSPTRAPNNYFNTARSPARSPTTRSLSGGGGSGTTSTFTNILAYQA